MIYCILITKGTGVCQVHWQRTVITASSYVDLACLFTVAPNWDIHRQGFLSAYKEKKEEWKKFPVEIK